MIDCNPKCRLAKGDDCDCPCEGLGHQVGLENTRDRKGHFIPLTKSAKIRQLARKGVATAEIAKQVGVEYHHAYSVVRTLKRLGL